MRAALLVVVGLATVTCGSLTDVGSPGAAPLPSAISRGDAIAAVRAQDANFLGRVDRADAKLMSLAEFREIAGPILVRSGDPSASPASGEVWIVGDPAKRYVWAVAISGEVYPQGRSATFFGHRPPVTPTPFPPYRWGLYLVDAIRGSLFALAGAGVTEPWPPTFSALPSHQASRYAAPSPTPTLTPMKVQFHAPEAQSDVMRRVGEVHRIERIEMKLMTWHEYGASGGPGTPVDVRADSPIWIVGVAGEIAGTNGPATWALYSVDASDETVRRLATGSDGKWPSVFEMLPSHPDPFAQP